MMTVKMPTLPAIPLDNPLTADDAKVLRWDRKLRLRWILLKERVRPFWPGAFGVEGTAHGRAITGEP